MKKREGMFWLFLLPALLGLGVFYIIPFFISVYYSLLNNNTDRDFVFLDNFKEMIKNPSFLSAFRSTIFFIALLLPIILIISFFFSYLLDKITVGKRIINLIFLLPMAVPSGTIIYFWNSLFLGNGFINKLLYVSGRNTINFSSSYYPITIILLLFLWRNTGYITTLFLSGLNQIDKDYYEVLDVEGGGGLDKFRYVIFPFLKPTILMNVLMVITFTFSIFKETYLLYGAYPNDKIYMIQHFINNNLESGSLQKASVSSHYFTILMGVFIFIFLKIQQNYYKKIEVGV